MLWLGTWLCPSGLRAQPTAPAIETIPGMPPVVDPRNLYSETQAGRLSPAVTSALSRVYVPNLRSHDVYVIDPQARKVVDRFRVGIGPQHVVPSWDLKTLWVTNNAEGRTDGSLTPIDPTTGKPGTAVPVDDPYNMYFTPDGRSRPHGLASAWIAGPLPTGLDADVAPWHLVPLLLLNLDAMLITDPDAIVGRVIRTGTT